MILFFFFFNDTATTEIYTLSPTRRSSDLHAHAHPRGVSGAAHPAQGGSGHAGVRDHQAVVLRPAGWRRCGGRGAQDRKSTRLNSSHSQISYAVFCLKIKMTDDIYKYVSHR